MTVEELCGKLNTLISGLNASGFGSADDGVFANLTAYAADADGLGMKAAKQMIDNLSAVLKTRKEGGSSDESVQVRLTALDFYIKEFQSGSTEDL
jgi:hypothetical protein